MGDTPDTWKADKRSWCCRVHHVGCPQPIAPPMPQPVPMPVPIVPRPPVDPYNCADGFANWMVGWSVGKKEWCCRVHGKGCPGQGVGCAPVAATPPHTIAMRDSPIGWLVGASPRNSGAAPMPAKAAQRRL